MDIRTDADDEGGVPPTHPPPTLPELEASVADPKGDPRACLRQGPRRASGQPNGIATDRGEKNGKISNEKLNRNLIIP